MKSMKQVLVSIIFFALAAAGALSGQTAGKKPQPTGYLVIPLPNPLGGTVSGANAINDLGWPMGFAFNTNNANAEAVVWIEGRMIKLGTVLGGTNSSVAWESVKNNRGLIVGISDTSISQPRGENFSCVGGGFIPPSGHTCLGFLWQNGNISPLPTLGGDNGFATGVNNAGQVIGWAETSLLDPTCASPQVLQFLPFVYSVKTQQISALQVYPGDSDGTADTQNDQGQIAGISGICENAVGAASATHAVFWQNSTSTPIDMGNLGGLAWNTPTSMNSKAEVVGFGNTSGDQYAPFSPTAFYWSQGTGMQNLGTISPYPNSIAYGINNKGVIVGQALNLSTGASHAFIYQNNIMTDLNALAIGNKAWTLVYANDINDQGVIVGGAVNNNTNVVSAFVAIPY